MADSVATAAVKLTANATGFAAGMAAAQKPLDNLQRKVASVNRIVRFGFGVFALKGFVGIIRKSWMLVDQLGIKISAVDRIRLTAVTAAFNRWRGAIATTILELGAKLAPAITAFLDKGTQLVTWLASKLTPAMLSNIGTVLKWAAGIYVGVKVAGLMAIALDLWTKRTQALAAAQAVLLALQGPKGWAILAVGIAVAAGTVYGLSKAFKSMSEEAQGGLHGTGIELDRLTAKMMRMEKGAQGIRGIDFVSAKTTAEVLKRTQSYLDSGGKSFDGGKTEVLINEARKQTSIMKRRTSTYKWEDHYGWSF